MTAKEIVNQLEALGADSYSRDAHAGTGSGKFAIHQIEKPIHTIDAPLV